jgi:hypothetical protein
MREQFESREKVLKHFDEGIVGVPYDQASRAGF